MKERGKGKGNGIDGGPVVAECIGLMVHPAESLVGPVIIARGGTHKERHAAALELNSIVAEEMGLERVDETESPTSGGRQFGPPSKWNTDWQPNSVWGKNKAN
ncbi:MAG: hypothetical protein Q7S79_03490 [bacterium]|nr:hypothetical protein [bacterium]